MGHSTEANDYPSSAVLAHRDRMASDWDDSAQAAWLADAGIDLIRGHARLSGPRRVTVGPRTLTANHAVAICTGTRAALPPGFAAVRPWTSREATSARTVPARLAILGGGVVAVGMATAWQALGTQVTLIVREDRLLPRVEPFAAALVTDRLRAAGADLHFTSGITHAQRTDAVRLLIDPHRRTIVGATFAGPGTAELLHSATIAITAGVPIDHLWHAVPPFPTISEVWLRLLETYRDRRSAAAPGR
ncbi:FAD-dependent oxidoreductase [Nocardia sp. NPDC057227]|uniref:FAD-dependent oxidoreductase n=1 Tax=Nocardia sp. NPDC057227 TaxID=3346056 RepID=UPI00363B1F22